MRGWLRRKVAHRVTVHTTAGASIEGVLKVRARDGLVLVSARYLDAEDAPSLDGETFIERGAVAFLQVHPAGLEV